jgi:hypothetical protein
MKVSQALKLRRGLVAVGPPNAHFVQSWSQPAYGLPSGDSLGPKASDATLASVGNAGRAATPIEVSAMATPRSRVRDDGVGWFDLRMLSIRCTSLSLIVDTSTVNEFSGVVSKHAYTSRVALATLLGNFLRAGVSPRTVETHVSSIRRKLQTESRTGTLLAIRSHAST